MTRKELKNLVPHVTMVCSKRDPGVGYTYMGRNKDGTYQLCGMPFGYEGYIMRNSFMVRQ